MADAEQLSILDTRRAHMFPVLDVHDFSRLRRFGDVKHFAAGSRIMTAGEARITG